MIDQAASYQAAKRWSMTASYSGQAVFQERCAMSPTLREKRIVCLPAEQGRLIDRRVAFGACASVSRVVRAGLRWKKGMQLWSGGCARRWQSPAMRSRPTPAAPIPRAPSSPPSEPATSEDGTQSVSRPVAFTSRAGSQLTTQGRSQCLESLALGTSLRGVGMKVLEDHRKGRSRRRQNFQTPVRSIHANLQLCR